MFDIQLRRGAPLHTERGVEKFHGMELYYRINRKVLLTTPGGAGTMNLEQLTDDELWDRTLNLASSEREISCDLVEHLAEIDRRRLSEGRDCGSLFDYCVHTLGYSEAAAFRRIRAARAIRIHPPIKGLLREGRLTLESVALLHPFLETPDAASLVQEACGLKVWQVQELIAGRKPDAPRRDVIRICAPAESLMPAKFPETEPLSMFAANASPHVPVQPSESARAPAPTPMISSRPPHSVRVAFTADAEFHKLMLRARALLRHKYPDGRLEGVLKDALVALLKKKDRGFGWTK
ncbi:MAG: hypothetical protein ACHQ51_08070 [Elusimicrobiota bacterium]